MSEPRRAATLGELGEGLRDGEHAIVETGGVVAEVRWSEERGKWLGVEARVPERCEFFHFIGASTCDNCGRPPAEHKGYRTLRRGASSLSSALREDAWENLTWDELEARARVGERVREVRERLDAMPDERLLALGDALFGACRVDVVSSRVCERGTPSCVAEHPL